MRRAIAVAALLFGVGLGAAPAGADKKTKPSETKPATSTSSSTGATTKVKTYDFGGLNVEGRMRTPQLLYFLNRMQAEFDQNTLDKRSFMPELKRSADDL